MLGHLRGAALVVERLRFVDGGFGDIGDRLRPDVLGAEEVQSDGAPDVRVERELEDIGGLDSNSNQGDQRFFKK
jgi:hypothetical protein